MCIGLRIDLTCIFLSNCASVCGSACASPQIDIWHLLPGALPDAPQLTTLSYGSGEEKYLVVPKALDDTWKTHPWHGAEFAAKMKAFGLATAMATEPCTGKRLYPRKAERTTLGEPYPKRGRGPDSDLSPVMQCSSLPLPMPETHCLNISMGMANSKSHWTLNIVFCAGESATEHRIFLTNLTSEMHVIPAGTFLAGYGKMPIPPRKKLGRQCR